MSEPGDLSQTIVEEGGPEQETATPENGVIKSESLDEEEKLELQRRLAAQNQERRKSKSGAGKDLNLPRLDGSIGFEEVMRSLPDLGPSLSSPDPLSNRLFPTQSKNVPAFSLASGSKL